MAQILFGVFVLLHGLVHGLYFGHSRRFFELQPGLTWPDGSWAFSGLLGEAGTRNLANVVLIVIAVAMIAGGIGIAVRQEWARTLTVSAAALSIVLYAALWNGQANHLDAQGLVGIVISAAIIVVLAVLRWPAPQV
jgi:hypothetical protein